MDRSAVKAIVDREIEPLLRRLGIPHWRITVSYEPAPPDADGRYVAGHVNRRVDYDQAHVTLNPEAFDDESDVLRVLRHELMHVVLSPYDVFLNAVQSTLDGHAAAPALQSVWTHCMERAVIHLERMYRGLTDPPPPPPREPDPCS